MHPELSVSLKPRAHAIAESKFSHIIIRRILETGPSIFQKIQRIKNILENLPKSIDLGPFRARHAQDPFSASKHVYSMRSDVAGDRDGRHGVHLDVAGDRYAPRSERLA